MKKWLIACAAALTACFCFTGCDAVEELKDDVASYFDEEKQIEETAVLVVNDIIRKNVGSGSDVTRCTKVKLKEKKGDNKWLATAYLENGNSINCLVEKRGSNQVYVEMIIY